LPPRFLETGVDFRVLSLKKKGKKDLEITRKDFYLCNAFFGPSEVQPRVGQGKRRERKTSSLKILKRKEDKHQKFNFLLEEKLIVPGK